MKPNSYLHKSRGRPAVRRNGGYRGQSIDSSGPGGKVRGNLHQVHEKYLALARDATSSGDRIAAEGFYQHAEHYYRTISAQNQGEARNGTGRPPRRGRNGGVRFSSPREGGEDSEPRSQSSWSEETPAKS